MEPLASPPQTRINFRPPMIMLAVFLFFQFSVVSFSGFIINQSCFLREIATVTICLFRFDDFFIVLVFIYFITVTSVTRRRRFPTDELCSVVP